MLRFTRRLWSTKKVSKPPIKFPTLSRIVIYPDSAKANVAIAGKIGDITTTTEELAKTTDGIEKNTDEIAINTSDIVKSTNEISNNTDEIKCSWSATSITCIANTETWPQGIR